MYNVNAVLMGGQCFIDCFCGDLQLCVLTVLVVGLYKYVRAHTHTHTHTHSHTRVHKPIGNYFKT